MLSTRDQPQNKGHIQTESEGLEKIFHANRDQKKAGVAILISDKIDFKTKAVNKRQRLAEWIQKQDPYICCLQETHLETKDTYRLKVKGWKKILHANRDQKEAGVAILISDKIDFKTKAVLCSV